MPNKTPIHGLNVGDDAVAVTEDYVKSRPNQTFNFKVGGEPVVASWDSKAGSMGIWKRKDSNPVKKVDVHGLTPDASKENALQRVHNVRPGMYWVIWQYFYPGCRLNPAE